MTTPIPIYSELHCPWAFVTVHRLRKARDRLGLDVVFDQRPWPLELVNGIGTPKENMLPETAVLAQHEETLFSKYRGEMWPSSFLPAFEAVAAARRALGLRGAEDVDYALRLAFFRDSVDVSIEKGITDAVGAAGIDTDAVMQAWRNEPCRADVMADFERSKTLPIQGSPQVFWPDGSTSHNPGMTDHQWVRGIPRIRSADAEEPGRLLLAHCG